MLPEELYGLFDIRETEFTVPIAPGVILIAKNDPSRVALIVSGVTAGVLITTNPNPTATQGVAIAGTNSFQRVEWTHNDFGRLVCVDWYAHGATGNITVIEQFLRRELHEQVFDRSAELLRRFRNGSTTSRLFPPPPGLYDKPAGSRHFVGSSG